MIPLALSTMPFVFGVNGFVRRCLMFSFLKNPSTFDGLVHGLPFFETNGLLVNSSPLLVKIYVISKG